MNHRLARRLPSWMGSIRFRLTALYSGLLFVVAAVFVVVLYALLERHLVSAITAGAVKG